MVSRKCDHHIAHIVRGQLTITGCCPSCVINHHIAEIKSTQAGLQRRGGIFASKEKALQEGQIQCKRHRAWTRKWKFAKIQCAKDVGFLETLRSTNPEMVKAEGIEAALDIWEHAREECSRVPGYSYLEDIDAEAIAEILNECGHDIANAKSLSNDSTVEQPIDEPDKADIGLDETILYEMDVVADRLEQSLHLSSSTPVDDQTSQPVQQHPEGSKSLCANFITQAHSQPRNPSLKSATFPPRSALKRVTFPHQPTKPRTANRILVSESVTIIPSLILNSDTDESSENSQLHNIHTNVHHHRSPSAYHRRSAFYEPATWTSPIGYEKINASHWRTDWDEYEVLAKLNDEDVDAGTGKGKEDVDIEGCDDLPGSVRDERSREDAYEMYRSRNVEATELSEMMDGLDMEKHDDC